MRRISQHEGGEFYGIEVEGVRPVMLYFLSEGRNAWYSTWVSRYFEGCMHTSFESACNSAERLRVQGTVFIIEELPAIEFCSKGGALLITLINHASPFSTFASKVVGNHLQGRIGYCASKPSTLMHAKLKFDIDSFCWRSLQKIDENNVHFLWAGSSEIERLKGLPRKKLRAWKSFSFGGDYDLDWTVLKSQISPYPTHRVVHNFLSQTSE